MPNDVTPAEIRNLERRLEDVRQGQRDRDAEVNRRMDGMVPLQLYNAHVEGTRREHDDLAKDIADLSARLDADQRQRAADRRLILMALFTSILAPLALLLIQAYLRGQGAGP